MAISVVIENVVLVGDDLNFVSSPWRSLNRANNLRLVPIALGFLALCFVLSFLIDPSLVELIALLAPLLLGWYGFIWFTNAIYLGGYKKAYVATAVGGEPCTFTFNENGLHQVMPRGVSSFRWSAFVEIVEDARGFRFWMTPFMAIFLPARFIDEANAESLRRLIADARERGDIKGVSE